MGQAFGGLALSIGGRLIGGFLGGPIGAAVGGLAGGLIGSLLFNRSQKPLIPDYQLANSSYGHQIPIIYGQERLPGTAIWETEIKTQSHGIGGKGMASGGTANSYKQSVAFAFCQGPATPLKIWLDGKLFFDVTSLNPHELTKYQFPIRVYNGTETQLPDPQLQIWVYQHATPPLSCPAYRGLCYMVFQDVDLAHFGNRMPNVTALWASNAAESIVIQQLKYWADDTDTKQLIGPYSGGVATDWLRLYAYTLTYDGILRVFDMHTGISIAKADLVATISAAGPLNLETYGPYNTGNWPFSAITAEPGGDVYVTNIPKYTHVGSIFTQNYIWRLDPTSLAVISAVVLPKPTLPTDYVADMVCFDIIGPLGVFPMIAGRWVIAGPFLIDPNFGYYSGILPVATLGVFAYQYYVVGKVDQTAGTVDVWFLNGSASPLGEPLLIYKAFVVGNDVSAIVGMGSFTLEATITPADYGLSTPGSYQPAGVSVVYDASDDTLIISDFELDATMKWSPTLGVVWVQDRYTLSPNQMKNGWDTASGRYADGFTNSTRTIWVDETYAGQEQSVYSSTDIGLGKTVLASWGYNGGMDALLFQVTPNSDGLLYLAYLQRQTGGEVRVADIITDLCERVGMTSDMIDVSLVTDTTIGYIVNEQKSAGQCVADLCHTYQIDMVESDYTLRFVPKGQASVLTITQDELAATEAQNLGHFWEAKRAQEQELPLQINVRHTDPALDFQANATYAKRTALPVPTTFSKRIKTVDLPIVATNEEARHIAEKWIYTMWAERDTYKTKLGWKHLFLDPTDTVTVNLDNGDSYVVRLETTSLGGDLSIDVELASEDATTYADSTSPGALVSFTPQTLEPAGFFDLLQFNVPLLQDSDDLGGLQSRIYYAAGPTSAAATSATATLYKSTDAVTWTNFNSTTGFVNWGRATTALPDTPAKFATDNKSTVTVAMVSGSTLPASCTYAEMMSGANAALLGSEIIQFQNVTTNSDGSITLDTIVRSRRGTEWATGTHVDGEVFVLLNIGEVTGTRLELSELNTGEFYKLVPLNTVLDRVATDRFTYLGYDMFPYAPVNFEATPQHSPTDLVLTWKRRTRIGGWMVDGSDTAPLHEASEAYEAYALANSSSIGSFDPTNAATYVRKFSPLSSATTTYTASEMVTDGFDPSTDTLYLAVYQLSAVTGRGFRGYQAIPAF